MTRLDTQLKVLIAAGGAGSHLFPAQQLGKMLLQKNSKVYFAGHKLENSIFFDKQRFSFAEIDAHPCKKGLIQPLWRGFWQSWHLLQKFSPDVVVGFGSYHVLPILLAAVVLRKKLILFEANSSLGKINHLFARLAVKVACQFPLNLKKKEVLVPLLPWDAEKKERISSREAKKKYGLDPDLKTILIFGGSQGAAFFNETIPFALSKLKQKVQVIHLTGLTDKGDVLAAYIDGGIRAVVQVFEKKMSDAYAAADLAICRSGAGTIAELIRFAVPALLIPYPFETNGHQSKNGTFLTHAIGGARFIDQRRATLEQITFEVEALCDEASRLKKILKKAAVKHEQRVHLAKIILEMG